MQKSRTSWRKSLIRFCISFWVYFGFFSFMNCGEKKGTTEVFSLLKSSDDLYFIQIKSDIGIDQWKLPYPVYRFQIGDIDGNGVEEAIVGVIKTTRFDEVMAKRIFIFENYKGFVRPLWLGSRLAQPLVDFSFNTSKGIPLIRSIEKEKSGKYLIAEYKWRKFGLDFVRYIEREVDSSRAVFLLKNH